jgi:hypothetical protein
MMHRYNSGRVVFRLIAPIAFATAILTAATQAPQEPVFKIGEQVPILHGSDLEGQPITVDYSRPTVLYFMTAFGHFVTVNEQPFASLVRQTGSKYAYYIVAGQNSEERLAEYVAKVRSGWGAAQVRIVRDVSIAMAQGLKMGAYPRTVVIAPGGRVSLCVEGTYQGWHQREVQDFFHIQLDGVPPL